MTLAPGRREYILKVFSIQFLLVRKTASSGTTGPQRSFKELNSKGYKIEQCIHPNSPFREARAPLRSYLDIKN